MGRRRGACRSELGARRVQLFDDNTQGGWTTMKIITSLLNAGRARGVAAALLLSLAAANHAALAADPIKIGVPVGLSGANSVVAPSVVQAAQLAVDEINAKGGILGRQVSLEVAGAGSGAPG